ncbi:nuclear pore complex protein Nup160 homolog [Malaya genurostris]|uniref:nuclear pore complex protein Nup160 homolog n=1 Tax=Malaya genurostris TaxID=325434 RepID=UPI0026F3E606|nr:nuclear pore complex protein Nup160 homolog [Malaya genurostris]
MTPYVPVQYREVAMRQLSSNSSKWREISISTGGIHNMLQDVKTSEQCGGYCFAEREDYRPNRFVYWRTSGDSIYLCEVSMNLNLGNNQLRISFDESPILSVEISGNRLQVFLLIVTVTSIHRIVLKHPKANSVNPDGAHESVLSSITKEQICDTTSFYVISNDIGQCLPNIAAAHRVEYDDHESDAFYAVSTVSALYLFQMGSLGGVKMTELKHNQLISRLFSNITDAWRKKNANAPDQIVSLMFGEIDGNFVLYAFYRNNIARVWSTNGSCIGVECMVKHVDQRLEGSQTTMVRKSASLIGVFLAYSECSEFLLFRPLLDESGNVSLVKESIILAPNYDLIDYKLSDRDILALWCNAEGEMQVLTYALNSESTNFWLPIPLETTDDKYTAKLEKGTDLKYVYCNRIFHSGKFHNNVIAKTLSMFNRSFSNTGSIISMAALKRHVCSYIDGELQNERKMQNITDEEFIELSSTLWEKFYMCCSQYNFEACQPIGMLILEDMNIFCLIRKKIISFFRPCDELELLFLSENYPGSVSSDAVGERSILQDVSVLVRVLKQIDKFVPEDDKIEIESCLFQLRSTKDVMETIAGSQCFGNQCTLTSVIQSIEDLPKAMAVVLQKLKLDYESDMDSSFYSNARNLPFGGLLGVQLLTETVRQMIQLRYMVVRNLIVLQHLLLNNFALNCNAMEIIRSKCIPDSEVFLQSYYVMNWIAESTVDYAAVRSKSLESDASLVIGQEEAYSFEYISLLHLFVATRGLKTSMASGASQHFMENSEWSSVLLDISNRLLRLIWPVAGDFTFGQWLMQGEMHIFIEEYVRLLKSWCEWNNCSRNFILAKSYLMNGENAKSLDLFPQSAKGIFNEPYLINFTKPSDSSSIPPDEMLSIFYLKVIRLFEHYGAYDCINVLAQIAIGTSVQSKQQAMFQSIDFSSHMELGHYEEAYHALVYNCEPTRKKDCLRQLVWRLFQAKKFNILIDLPYYGLEMDFQNIMEMHARSVEITENSHYDFLYSYFILKGNMRKAALISYEKAMRCQLECNSLIFVKMRCESLLKCVNALNLVAPDYAWIAKPTVFKENKTQEERETQIVVISLADVRKELMVTEAVLEISKQLEDYKAVLDVDTAELIVILANAKLYATAFKLAHSLGKSVLPVYESLASACVMCAMQDTADSWEWLHKNNLTESVISIDSTSTAWNYLHYCLSNETENQDACHVSVMNQIISKNAFPPQWLTDYCMNKTPTKLLQMYVNYGRLEEAYEIAVKLIQPQLISRSSITSLHLNRFLLPVTLIDRLQYELRKDSKFQKQTHVLGQLIDCIAK